MPETFREKAAQHVAEGRRRIEQQQRLIDELRRDGHDNMLQVAEKLLQALNDSQRMFEDHLAQAEAEHAPGAAKEC